jgi:predicted deacylase
MDIHANPLPAMGFTLVSKSASAETFRLARAFGLTVISQTAPSNYSRGLREILGEKGVPMFCPELPGNIYYADHLAEMGERGALNVMKALGMIDGKAEPQRDTLVLPGEYEFVTRLRVNRGGLLRPTAPPGTLLAKGSPAMEIINFLGEVVEEVLMPCEGYCWSFSTGSNVSYSAVVSEGQRVGYVFRRVGCA